MVLRGCVGGRCSSGLALDMKGRESISLSGEKGLGVSRALGLLKTSEMDCSLL